MPFLTAHKTEHRTTFTFDRYELKIIVYFDGSIAIGCWTPSKQTIGRDEAVGGEPLVALQHFLVVHYLGDRSVIDYNVTSVLRTTDAIADAFAHDFVGEV